MLGITHIHFCAIANETHFDPWLKMTATAMFRCIPRIKVLAPFIVFMLFTSLSVAQISFEQGYYVDNMGTRVEGLVKNNDWRNNPTSFEFKVTENTSPQRLEIGSVQEFGIGHGAKYQRARVDIDRSSQKVSKHSVVRQPILNEEELFLKVLVEGERTLFLYDDKGLRRFFFETDSLDIEQLIYKTYRTAEDRIGINESYKQQLLKNLDCQGLPKNRTLLADYRRRDLTQLFVEYNECINAEFINFERRKERADFFQLTIKPALNSSWLQINNNVIRSLSRDFDQELSPQLGVEAEFTLPFNKNKWAVFLEPSYQSYRSEKETTVQKSSVSYEAFVIAIGVKYYSFISDRSKLFLTGSGNIAYSSRNSKVQYERSRDLDLHRGLNTAVGLGFSRDKLSIECRYGIDRAILFLSDWNSDFSTISFIAGYRIL